MSARSSAGCVYCGFPRARVRTAPAIVVTLPACVAHVDLLELDPAYNLAGYLASRSYPALDLARSPSSARRERPATRRPRPSTALLEVS